MEDEVKQGFQLDGHDVGEYTITSAATPDALVKKVNAFINQKWVPIGSPVPGTDAAGRPMIIQALIRSKSANKKKISRA